MGDSKHWPKGRCYGCFRPLRDCFCELIPSIDNRTELLILQHSRERFHPFNTARIVHRAARNSTLLHGYVDDFAGGKLPLRPDAALLYPDSSGSPLEKLEVPPSQLVIIDGTWHHTKTMLRDVHALSALPRYSINPPTPGRFRIRREPSSQSLSTLEATVHALQVLEPETPGRLQLLAAFDRMVERQLAHPSVSTQYRKKRKRPPNRKIPAAFLGDRDNLVVAYGETTPGQHDIQDKTKCPIYWVAERLGTRATFACAVEVRERLSHRFLDLIELRQDDFFDARSVAEFRHCWESFLRPSDTLLVYNNSAAKLLSNITANFVPHLALKTVHFNIDQTRYANLDELIFAKGLSPKSARLPGRAGRRLANAVAMTEYLIGVGEAFRDAENGALT